MSQPARIADPVSAAFGADKPSVTYDHIAQQVKAMQPSALTPSQFDDVIVLIEFMRDQAIRMHELNVTNKLMMDAREVVLEKRERDVGIRGRAVDAAIRGKNVFARYFKR